MKRLLRIAVIAVLGGVVLLVAIVAGLRALPAPPERLAARALMEQPTPPVAGRDGSDAAWLLDHDVPVARQAEVARAYRQYLEARATLLDAGRRADAAKLVDPLAAFPAFTDVPRDAPGLCAPLAAAHCLDVVRADPAASAALLAEHARQLAATNAFLEHDGVRYGIRPGPSTPVPNYGGGHNLTMTAIAERFVRGDHGGAIAGACREAAAWRRIGADNDQLIGNMVAAAHVRSMLQLLAVMLAERPAGEPLPPACKLALAATIDAELDLCPAMRGEFAYFRTTLAQVEDPKPDTPFWIVAAMSFYDPDHVATALAPILAHQCSPAMHALQHADRSARSVPPADVACGRIEAVVRAADCWVTEIAASNFADYTDRRTDLAAEIALMRTWLWLRAQDPDPSTWPALWARRPAALGLRREPRLASDGLGLEIELLRKKDGPYALALPRVANP